MAAQGSLAVTFPQPQSAQGLLNLVGLVLSGGFGGLCATIADALQKDQACTILKLRDCFSKTLGLPVSALLIVALLIALAIGLCLVFRPQTNPAAFFRGASVIALLMTAVPYDVPPALSYYA